MLQTLWFLLRESATFLLVGLLIAALLDALMAGGWMVHHLASRRPRSVVLATLVGLPLPLCSCSVLPTALALRERGASRGATLAFLISTPETSVTSILLSWGLLGPVMAVARPVAACLTAILAGLAEGARDQKSLAPAESGAVPDLDSAQTSCCNDPSEASPTTFAARARAGLTYAFGDLLGDIFGWVLLGIVAAAAIATWVPAETIAATLGDSWVAMPAMVLIGVPLYICAEASTPLAAALVAQGMSPGAALVLLLVGPATNIGALGALRSKLGGPTVGIYLTTIIVVALASGTLLDAWLGGTIDHLALPDLSEPMLPGPIENVAAVVFLGLGLTHLFRRRSPPCPAVD